MEPTTIGQESTPSTPEESKAPTPEERSEAQRNWFNNTIRGVRGIVSAVARGAQDQPAAKEEDDDSPDASAPAESTPTAKPPGTPPPVSDGWKPPTNAEEERRRYQSIRDQERAQQQAADLQTRQQEEAAQIRSLEDEKRELLKDKEDWRVGEQVAAIDRKIDAIKSGNAESAREQELVGGVMAFYDAIYGDRFLQALPQEDISRILAQPYHGPEGRQRLAEETLTALTKHFKGVGAKEEREKLEKSQSYRKQLAQEFGVKTREEPELITAAAGSASGPIDMNQFIRRAAGR